ncbi:MFS transporter [Umezawaea tangerina]|uniref:Putative MFS family arabinose efflux permease n=1 Tax=Umezawaea tangerina TaxID=84725 RepID=A0A2T0T7N8_9PSEU|nr:MFS transporter [Umezawaea tangerina]PRY41654.1 putative MFS family arabinose efflux permease [Umezawaea tangerina]
MSGTTRQGSVTGREFRLFWFGETTSLLGNGIAVVALPLVAVLTLHASTFVVGLLTSVAHLPWLVLGLPAGAWVDRLARRPVMLVADAVSFVAFLSVPIAAWADVLTIPHLLAAAFVCGCASVFFTTAQRAFLPTLLSDKELLAGNARLQGSQSTAEVIGPGLAGMLVQFFGAVAGLAANALSFLVSWLCLRAIRITEPPPPPPPEVRRRRLRTEVGDGLRFLFRDPVLRTLAAYSAVSNIALTAMSSIEVAFLVRTVGTGEAVVGAVLTLCGLGGVLGALLSHRLSRRYGSARAAVGCLLVAAPFTLLFPLTSQGAGLAFFVGGGVGVGAGAVAANIITDTFRQRYCPPDLIGRISASAAVISFGAITVGGLLGGTLGELCGVRETLWMMAGLQVSATAILLRSPIRRMHDFPESAVPLLATKGEHAIP